MDQQSGASTPGYPRRKKILIITVAVVIVIVAIGATFFILYRLKLNNGSSLSNLPINANNNVSNVTETDFTKTTFATYQAEHTTYKPAVPPYNLALTDISNLSAFEKALGTQFSAQQKNDLLQNNFFIAKNADIFYSDNPDNDTNRVDDWIDVYTKIDGSVMPSGRLPENSVFISSDFLLHVYHRLLEKEFEYIEQSNFYQSLTELSNGLLQVAAKQYSSVSDQNQKESFDRLTAYFLVPSTILATAADDYDQFTKNYFAVDSTHDSKNAALQKLDSLATSVQVSDNARSIAKQELGLIFDSSTLTESPLMGKYQKAQGLSMPEDYTQFTPRSHYAKNAILRDYFRAMMWYGRMNFLLSSPELTRDAININLLLSNDDLKQWQSIYNPTAFFVGQSDDLGIYEYRDAMQKVSLNSSDKINALILSVQEKLKTYNNPQIMSSAVVGDAVLGTSKEELQNKTKGFRFMGQRFTADAFVFSTLTQGNETPDPKTGQRLPSTPTALMVASLMGSKISNTLLADWIKTNAPDSDKVIADRMTSLEKYFNGVSLAEWTQNIYWSWLYTLKSVLTDNADKTGFPMFVKNSVWDTKNLQSFLGSWTELKHDTLLYAKQSYAELGGGGPDSTPPAVPKGYVEPNIEFFDRLISLATLSRDGLKQYGLLPDTFETRNNTLLDALKFFRDIALAELQNQVISDDDFERLRLRAGVLSQLLRPVGGEQLTEKQARSAIIADVHTDVAKGQILYEADGIPNYIFVAVKDANGTRLTKGLVYSYYEFTAPLAKRLTDQDWQQWSYSDNTKLPAMATWNSSLIK